MNNVKSVSWQSFNNGLSSTAKMKKRNEPKGKRKAKLIKGKATFEQMELPLQGGK